MTDREMNARYTLLEKEYICDVSDQRDNESLEDYVFEIDQHFYFDEDREEDGLLEDDEELYDFSSRSEMLDDLEKLFDELKLDVDWIDDTRFYAVLK